MISTDVFTLDVDATSDTLLSTQKQQQQQQKQHQNVLPTKRDLGRSMMMPKEDDDVQTNENGQQSQVEKKFDKTFELPSDDPNRKRIETTFSKSSKTGLARFYRQKDGSMVTSFKTNGVRANGNAKLIRDGEETFYDIFGNKVRSRTFVDGHCNGKEEIKCAVLQNCVIAFSNPQEKIWVEHGTATVCTRNWKNGLLHGLCTTREMIQVESPASAAPVQRYRLGKIETSIEYENGLKHGNEIRRNVANSKVLYTCQWRNGQKEGREVLFFRNGRTIAFEANYVNGTCLSRRTYYRSGNLRSSRTVDNNQIVIENLSGGGLQRRQCTLVRHEETQRWVKHGVETCTDMPTMIWNFGIRMQDDRKTAYVWPKISDTMARPEKRAKNK